MILITASEKNHSNNEEVKLKLDVLIEGASGFLFYVVHRNVSQTRYVPVYKSEI